MPLGSGEEHLGRVADLANQRRHPVDVPRPFDLPHVLAVLRIDGREERFAGVVHRHDQPSFTRIGEEAMPT